MTMAGPFGPRPEGKYGYIDDDGRVRVADSHVIVFKWILDCCRWSHAMSAGAKPDRRLP